MFRTISVISSLALAAAALVGCSAAQGGADAEGSTTLRVGVSPSPHGKILEYVADNLAADAGLNIDVVEYTDYVQPNVALRSGDLDANWFQHIPYLEAWAGENGWEFERGEGTHLEPLGLYSANLSKVSDKPSDARIGIINDPTNQERALTLLADQGFVELPATGDVNAASVTPLRGTQLVEVEGPALVRNLQDLDFAVINGNFAQEGGLAPADAVAPESTAGNPYVNVMVWNADSNKIEDVRKLDMLLHSDEVREFISRTWPDKSVIPAA